MTEEDLEARRRAALLRLRRRPIITYRLELYSGEVLERAWTLEDLDRHDRPPRGRRPDWLERHGRVWPAPSSPIIVSGRVAQGAEAQARAWLGLPSPRSSALD